MNYNDELLAAVRQDHPELKQLQDGELLSALAKDHPELFPAGELAYKQATARQNFEANKPVPTAATGLQRLGEGAVDSILGIPAGMYKLGKDAVTGNAAEVGKDALGALEGIVKPPVDYVQALRRGDPDAAAYAGGQGLVQTVPAVYGGVKAAKGMVGTPVLDAALAEQRAAVQNAGLTSKTIRGKAVLSNIESQIDTFPNGQVVQTPRNIKLAQVYSEVRRAIDNTGNIPADKLQTIMQDAVSNGNHEAGGVLQDSLNGIHPNLDAANAKVAALAGAPPSAAGQFARATAKRAVIHAIPGAGTVDAILGFMKGH